MIKVRKNKQRLLFNCWRRPFPYLFHPWETTEIQDDGNEYKYPYENFCMTGTKRSVGKWVSEWDDAEWKEWLPLYDDWAETASPGERCPIPSPKNTPVAWAVHVDINKAHRCPVCQDSGGIQDQIQRFGYPGGNKHMFTCSRCGQQFSDRWSLRSYPGAGDSQWNRIRYIHWRDLKWKIRDYAWELKWKIRDFAHRE